MVLILRSYRLQEVLGLRMIKSTGANSFLRNVLKYKIKLSSFFAGTV